MSAAAQVIPFPRSWCYAVPWLDVYGDEHETAVRDCRHPGVARLSVAVIAGENFHEYLGEPYPVPERA